MSVNGLMMNPLYSSWNNALDYSRYPRGNTAPTVLPQMHYRYRGSTVHSVPSTRYYREILPIPTVITAVTAVLPHSPLPCHSLVATHDWAPGPGAFHPAYATETKAADTRTDTVDRPPPTTDNVGSCVTGLSQSTSKKT